MRARLPSSKSPKAKPVRAAEFDRLMRAVGPFEPDPVVAVAVSGGADSMALGLLAADWTRRRGGAVVALTVDHGLRPESRAEARQVGAWLGAVGIRHHVLRWTGPKPAAGLPAAAREARYRLLTGWCERRAVLHLLLAHQRDDQAETFLMRLARSSGTVGLSAMSPVSETAEARLLRPLLAVPRARLEATLAQRSQPWIDDPSNRDPAFTRARVRRLMRPLAEEGLTAEAIAASARKIGEGRGALEETVWALLARAVEIRPEGYARLNRDLVAYAPGPVGAAAFAAVLACIGGRAHAPRTERLERLCAAVRDGTLARPRTLGGCLVVPSNRELLIVRELAAAREAIPVDPGSDVLWDGRFRMRIGAMRTVEDDLSVRALGDRGWDLLARGSPSAGKTTLPHHVCMTLPAVWGRRGMVFSPFFPDAWDRKVKLPRIRAEFRPGNPLTKSTFSVV